MESKEQWIDEVLSSLDGAKHLQASNALQQQIVNKIPKLKPRVFSLLAYQRWVAAACILILLGINIWTLIQYHQGKRTKETATMENPVYKEYFTFLNEF